MVRVLGFLVILCAVGILVIGNSGCRKKADADSGSGSTAQAEPQPHTHTPAVEDSDLKVEWLTDFAAAKTKAAAEGKDILLNFSGSDWCPWCIKLDEEVFNKYYFKAHAPKYFILVNVDIPNDKSKIPLETQKQNDELVREFGIQGFPTVLLMDAQGEPYAGTGYQAGGPEKYIQHLLQLRAEKAN